MVKVDITQLVEVTVKMSLEEARDIRGDVGPMSGSSALYEFYKGLGNALEAAGLPRD